MGLICQFFNLFLGFSAYDLFKIIRCGMADPEDDNPNANMSMREQFGQYAFGRTVADVMTNPERDASEIVNAAARAGMDVIFGEDHRLNSETIDQMRNVMESMRPEHVKAIVFESPVEVQHFLEPSTVQSLTLEEFFQGYVEAEAQSMATKINQMYEENALSQWQYEILMLEEELIMEDFRNIPPELVSEFAQSIEPLYNLVLDAAERGIPVIAADIDRNRGTAIMIAEMGIWDPDGMDIDDADRILHEEMDDTSDVEYLERLGINSEDPGVMIVHRGYDHINNIITRGIAGNLLDLPATDGFDEVLENQGRHVLTVAVQYDYERGQSTYGIVTDPADIAIYMNSWTGELELDRSEYAGESQFAPQNPFLDDENIAPDGSASPNYDVDGPIPPGLDDQEPAVSEHPLYDPALDPFKP